MTRIAVDPNRLLGHLDRNVFCGFIEHLGRSIYGGIYDEGAAGWPLASWRSTRRMYSSA